MCDLCRDVASLSEPTMGFGWVMPCVTCTFCESSWKTGSVSSDIVAPIFDAVLVWLPGLLRQW